MSGRGGMSYLTFRDSPILDRMPHLKQLVLSGDDGSASTSQPVHMCLLWMSGGGGTPYLTFQDSPSLDRMPHLKQLVLSGDDGSASTSQPEKSEESLNDMLANGVPETRLGQAVANLHASWTQLICDLSARTGYLPPTLEHIKEVAECAIRQLKDSCHDLTREFARVGLEWRLTHPDEALSEDLADLDQAILRQETLLGRAAGIVQRRLGDFANENSVQEFE